MAARRRHLIGAATAAAALFLLPGPAPAAECDSVDAGKCRLTLPSGAELAYVEAGSTDGPAVILLHGLTDSARSWSGAMQAMRVEWPDLRLIALDQRGHGASSMPDPAACRAAPEACFKMADFAADLLAFMDAKRIRSATLVGHSMGSFVAQEVALTAPDRVDRLVLVATAGRGQGNPVLRDYVLEEPVEGSWRKALEAAGKAFPEEVYGLTPRAADPDVERWLAASWDVDPVADPALVARIVEETAEVRLGTWIGATRGMLAMDNRERLRDLRVPALVLWGRQDAIFTEPDQEEIRAALAAAQAAHGTPWAFKTYGALPLPPSGAQESDLGHNLQWEAPEAVAADILALVETGSPTGDLVRTAGPADPRELVVEPGKAETVTGKP
jgi:pimeloyl-ACP methyl ester carboxylesterase